MGLKRIFTLATLALLAGCASTSPPSTRPVTDVPAIQNKTDYWFDLPAVASVKSLSFDDLWSQCERTIRDYQFDIDWMDWRDGVMSSKPMDSKMSFEVWRSDAGDVEGTVQDSLQSVRRTARFEITRSPEGEYIATPKVVKERLAVIAQRLTSVEQYRGAFLPVDPDEVPLIERGQAVPSRYWYAFGRDENLEREMADTLRRKLKP